MTPTFLKRARASDQVGRPKGPFMGQNRPTRSVASSASSQCLAAGPPAGSRFRSNPLTKERQRLLPLCWCVLTMMSEGPLIDLFAKALCIRQFSFPKTFAWKIPRCWPSPPLPALLALTQLLASVDLELAESVAERCANGAADWVLTRPRGHRF